MAFFPDRTHLYESDFSLYLKGCTWNSVSGRSLLATVGPVGYEKAFRVPSGRWRTVEGLLSDWPDTQWAPTKTVIRHEPLVCPVCFENGFHFPVFQLTLIRHCPQHLVELRRLGPQELDMAGMAKTLLECIPVPPAQEGRGAWPWQFAEPTADFDVPRIVDATNFIMDALARRKARAFRGQSLEFAAISSEREAKFTRLTLDRWNPEPCEKECLTAVLLQYGRALPPPGTFANLSAERILIRVPDALRNRLKRPDDDPSSNFQPFWARYPHGRWAPVDEMAVRKGRPRIESLTKQYVDVRAVFGAWSRSLVRFHDYFRVRHGACLGMHEEERARCWRAAVCVESDAFMRVWAVATTSPNRELIFFDAAEPAACPLIEQFMSAGCNAGAAAALTALVLEEAFCAFWLALHNLTVMHVLKELSRPRGREPDRLKERSRFMERTNSDLAVLESLCAPVMPNIILDLGNLPEAIGLSLVPFFATVAPVREQASHVGRVRKELDAREDRGATA